MTEKYKGISDEELIDRLRQGENGITDFIMDKYKNLVRKKAKSMYILGADNDDLIQEGMIGLFKAVRDYDAGRDANFYTFADLCISRQMYNAVQASRREKHAPLNTYFSLYASMAEQLGDERGHSLSISLNRRSRPIPKSCLSTRKMSHRLRRLSKRSLAALKSRCLTFTSRE